jgi:hypothetical protein
MPRFMRGDVCGKVHERVSDFAGRRCHFLASRPQTLLIAATVSD